MFGSTGENDLILHGQVHFLEDVSDVLHRVRKRISGSEVADDGDFPLALETVDLIRPARLFQFHEIRELHQRRFGSVGVGREREAAARARAHHDFAQRLLRAAVVRLGPQPDIVLVVRLFVSADDVAAHQRVQRVGDVGHAQPEMRGFGPVNLHLQFRFAIRERRVHIHDAFVGAQSPDDPVRVFRKLVEVRAQQVERQIRVAAASADVGNQLHAGTHVGIVGQSAAGQAHDLKLRPPARPAEQR